jgi:hypothetical protein
LVEMGVSQMFCQGWSQTMIFPISASQLGCITGVSHHYWPINSPSWWTSVTYLIDFHLLKIISPLDTSGSSWTSLFFSCLLYGFIFPILNFCHFPQIILDFTTFWYYSSYILCIQYHFYGLNYSLYLDGPNSYIFNSESYNPNSGL